MQLNNQKEEFSIAYVHAVASAAGCAVDHVRIDNDSVDLTILSWDARGAVRSPRMDVQMKCTSAPASTATAIAFRLPMKNFTDLRADNVQVPRILVAMVVPDAVADWLNQSEQETALRHCAYWLSLRGHTASSNRGSLMVHVPRTNLFTVAALAGIMQGLSQAVIP